MGGTEPPRGRIPAAVVPPPEAAARRKPALDNAGTRATGLATSRPLPSVEKQNPMNEENTAPAMPDRLSVDPRSPHHIAAVFERDIGIRLNGQERSDVEEYCISEGWVRVPAGKAIDRKGHPLMLKLKGKVEAYYK